MNDDELAALQRSVQTHIKVLIKCNNGKSAQETGNYEVKRLFLNNDQIF